MWPSYKDGDESEFLEYNGQMVSVGDLIVFKHPFKNSVTCVKRVKTIRDKGFFVEGDNPDPLASEDSHNFGVVSTSAIIAFLKA